MIARAPPLQLLFVCKHNSARSILAEGLANQLGAGRLLAFSAGSHPSEHVHPLALAVLREWGCDSTSCRSKFWDEFAAPGAEPVDVAITVCDAVAGEVCPLWPGAPIRVHWALADPARVEGRDVDRLAAFRLTAERLERRLRAVSTLPPEYLERSALRLELQRIHLSVL